MAQQTQSAEWKIGSKCDVFNRDKLKWEQGEVVGSFTDVKGQWVKVRCGQRTRDILAVDPDLRIRKVVQKGQLVKLERAAAQMPSIKPILNDIIPPTSGQGFYVFADREKQMTWFKVINCVNTELFPVLGITLKKCIDEKLSEDSKFKPDDFDDKVIEDVMKRLKAKRTMNNKEIEYLMALFERAVDSQKVEKKPNGTNITFKKCKDINPKWSGLTVDILHDIFGAHKALMFGRLQRADYSVSDFMKDVNNAENEVFGDAICTPHLSKEDPQFALSFYPEYLVNDDVFAVMACHFAVSAVVRSMTENVGAGDQLSIRSVVIPAAICSRYDVDIEFQPTVTNMLQLMKLTNPKCSTSRLIDAGLSNVTQISETIQSMISQLNYDGTRSKNIVIVFDRYKATADSLNTVSIFECDDWSNLKELHKNYFLSFDFNISRDDAISVDDNDTVVQCWMHFGVGQRLRFYPEYVVWIIPHLFVRSTKMTAHKFLEQIYGEHYKHGWRVSLDDPIFNKYYHIIAQHEHISNNYNRDEVEEKQKGVQRLLRDYLEKKLIWNVGVKFGPFVDKQAYDSDAILLDMEDVNDSNIQCNSGLNHVDLRGLKTVILKFQNMECTEDSVRELADCEHIDILIENLRKFQECELVVDALNVIQFQVDSVIAAFDHIIKVHGFLSDTAMKAEIQNFISKCISCSHGPDCVILKEHSQRTRERENIEEKREELVHEVDTLCEVTADTLHSVHCYVLHRDEHLYRLLSGRENDIATRFSTTVDEEDQKEDIEDVHDDAVKKTVKSHGINFGLNILRWLPYGQQPHCETLNDEITRNPESTIDGPIFQQYLMICLAKIKGTNYTVNEMMCMKLYTDTNELQSQLRRAHWTKASLETRKGYYLWAMGLYRTHLYHAVPIPTASSSSSKPCRLYHGLNRLFTVSREMPIYFGPFSTTIAKTVASTFCNNKGLIWLLQSSYANPLKLVVGINVDWISGFKHEREVLLYNQCLPIQETETFDDDSDILMNHFIHSLISRESPIIKVDAFYKQLGIGLDAEWMHSICDHDLLFEKTECKDMRVVDRLVKELGVSEPDLMVKLWTTKHDDKSELEYLVENLNATQLSDHHQVMTSKFEIKYFSPSLNRTWLRFTESSEDDCIKASEYKANGMSVDVTTTCCVRGQVTDIKVKNCKLFGNRFLNLQSFDKLFQEKDVSDDFIDSLTVDKYGFVFVDNIPKMNRRFAVGDKVHCEDGALGDICEFKADEICIDIIDERRWIERSVVPLELTVVFPHQQDIGKYGFMLHSSADDHDPNNSSSDAHLLSFSDLNQFEIPYDSMRCHQSDVAPLAIYVKPKGTALPLMKIKSIEYPSGVADTDKFVPSRPTASESNMESNVDYLMKMLKERDSEIKDEEAVLNSLDLRLDQKQEWMEYITEHPLLFNVTLYRRKLVIERLIVELGLLSPEWVLEILEQTMNDKPMLKWLVEDRKIRRLLDHYQVITSKFKILHFSPLLNRSLLKLESNSKMQALDVATGNDYAEDNEYKVNGEIFTTTTFSVKGKVTKIQVKNSKLFGKQFATLQTFMEENDETEASDTFVDSLSVDRYGFLFLNDIPKHDHQFMVGDVVKRKDNSLWIRGVISRIAADGICVKTGAGTLCSFQWIDRNIIPKTVILPIPHEKDIGKYEFAICAEVEDDSQEVGDAKKFSFSEIEQFEIPYSSMKTPPTDVISLGVYVKPKEENIPLIKIKSIKYSPENERDSISVMDAVSAVDTESMVNKLMITLKDIDSEIRDEVALLHSFGLDIDRQSGWIQCIPDHSKLFDLTSYRRKLIIERLIVELNLMDTEWFHRILEQTKNGKPMLEWLVEDRKVFRLLDHYRVMTSKFKMEKCSKLLNCSWFSFQRNTKVDYQFGIESDDTVCYEETEYLFDGIPLSFRDSMRDGTVKVVTARNSKLFGVRPVILQQLEQKEHENIVKPQSDIRGMITIDKEAVIAMQLAQNQRIKVRQNGDWIHGVVSRKMADIICVKIGDGDMWTFLWIHDGDIWNNIKIEHENETSEFEFAARAGSKGNVDELTNLKRFTFDSIGQFQIKTDSLPASSKSPDAVHIYAKPQGKNVQYHHIKTVEHHSGPCFFSRYFVKGTDPFRIDQVVKVNPFSEHLQTGGRFEVITSSNIVISECGGINASECGLKMDSKHVYRSIFKFGEYVGEPNAEDDPKSATRVDGSGGGVICLIAGDAVVNRGTLSCKGTDGGLFSGGTICILSDGAVENKGTIDGGQDSEFNIQCDQLINEGEIVPAPNVIIGTSKSLHGRIRNNKRCTTEGLLSTSLRCFDFKHLCCKVLEFSSEFKTDKLILEDQKMWVMSGRSSDDHTYALTTEDPVFTGTHCWRIQVKEREETKSNTTSRWIMWAVSEKREFKNYSHNEAWGVAWYNHNWYPKNSAYTKTGVQNNQNDVKLDQIFNFVDRMEVDMLFDVDQRILRLCVVGKCEPQKEAKIWNIKHPKNDDCGWVPHLNIHSRAIKARIASIPAGLYGQPCADIWP